LYAQSVTGTVIDVKTNEPISWATVYLEGTTIGTTTDAQGKFNLTVKDKVFTNLIISCVGYESATIENPFDNLPEIIYLKEKDYSLDEVVVSKKQKFSRKQKLRAFHEQFLGMSEFAKSCRILNEDSIMLRFDDNENVLYATANVPIEIENIALAYKIKYELAKFALYLKSDKSLYSNNVDSVVYMGRASFEECLDCPEYNFRGIYDYNGTYTFFPDPPSKRRHLEKKEWIPLGPKYEGKTRIEFNRAHTYCYSQQRFFKEMADMRLDTPYFYLVHNQKLWNEELISLSADSVFIRVESKDTTVKQFVLNPVLQDSLNKIDLYVGVTGFSGNNKQSMTTTEWANKYHTEELGLWYAVNQEEGEKRLKKIQRDFMDQFMVMWNVIIGWSTLSFKTNKFCVDKYGNTDLGNSLQTGGKMATLRVGDMLPFDYLLPENYNLSILLYLRSIFIEKWFTTHF
jgi:hypothetical protein